MKKVLTFVWAVAISLAIKSFAGDNRLQQFVGQRNITAQAETDKYYWAGTNHGLYFMHKKGGPVYHMTTANSLLLSDSITCMAAKADGEVYIGTRRGIVRYDNFTFLLMTRENSPLHCNRITALVCPNGTDIFAGTYTGGLTVFSDLKAKTFTSENAPLSNNHVVSINKTTTNDVIAQLENNSTIELHNGQVVALKK